ncbi:hypothetical protein [Geomonas ferrireducens]|uniref:hypothetical protein n=1 Tax=Geomonas ferrireducens TaxID=2570227 RepID=UPI0013A5E449|nr:hypothetical protein [Geomonas ferrireducens]
MKRMVMLVVLAFSCQVSLSCATGNEVVHRANGKFIPDQRDVESSPTEENACECCQKCKAAQKQPTKPPTEREEATTTGCEDCCQRCGRPVQPLPEDVPPEIINKPRQK